MGKSITEVERQVFGTLHRLFPTFVIKFQACSVRSIVINKVYQKSTKINISCSENEETKTSTGQIMNLMTVDAESLLGFVSYMHRLWSIPLEGKNGVLFLDLFT
jgi:hypothetical protein